MTEAKQDRRAGLTAEITAVLIRYRRRISDRGGVVPDACLDELVAVAERHGGEPATAAAPIPGAPAGRRQMRRQAEPAEIPA